MRASSGFFTSIKRCFLAVPFGLFMALPAHAVIINFDDLTLVPSDPDVPCFCDYPLTNEYASQGLIIEGGFLAEYGEEDKNTVSGPNYLLGSNYLRLSFVGTLPTFISMIVSAAHEEAIYFDVFGSDGLIDEQQTNGYAGPHNDTPYTPNQLMTFTSAEGISSVVIEGFYNLRTSAMIDDLTYEYTSVPAPSSLVLLGLGLLGLAWCRRGNAVGSGARKR